MKKLIITTIAVLTLILASCGGKSETDERSATTFELKEDGSVVHTIVEKNDNDYPEEEIKSFFEQEIASYNEPYEEPHITLDEFEIKDGGTIYASMTYTSVEDYASFNDVICYTGTLTEALKNGYSFERDMTAASGVRIVGFTLPAEYPSLDVLILQESMEVVVPGSVAAYSSQVIAGENSVYAINSAPDERLPEYFRTVNSIPEYIVYYRTESDK